MKKAIAVTLCLCTLVGGTFAFKPMSIDKDVAGFRPMSIEVENEYNEAAMRMWRF